MAGTELGKAWVQIVPSAEGISGSIQKIIDPEANSAGKSAGSKLIGSIKKAIVGAGIGAALTKTIQAGANLEQSLGGIETIYGDAAAKAKEYALAAAQAGISQNTFNEQAVSFGAALRQAYEGDTTKALDAANRAILDMTDNAAKMGTPIQSIQDAYQGFAKQNYTMLDNLKLGYGGTKTEMERLLAEAQEISGIEYNIDNLGDVYNAIHVIQEELGLSGVAAQEASTTLSGSFGAMKAAAENLMGSLAIGEGVKENMKTLADSAVTFLAGNLLPAIGNVLQGLPGAFSVAFDSLYIAVLRGMGNAKEAVAANMPQMVQSFLTGLLDFSSRARAFAGHLVDVGMRLIKAIADGIIKSLPTIIETVPTIISNFAGIINDNAPKIITTGISIIKALAVGLIKAIPVLIANLPKILMAIWDVFTAFQWLNLGKQLVSKIGSGIKGGAKAVSNAVKGLMTNTKNTVVKGFTSLKGSVTSIWNSIKTAISHPIQTAVSLVKTAISKIKATLSGKISLPHIKLPHFSITGKLSLNPPQIPHFSVSWYRKAENAPYLFKDATLFGAGEGTKDEMLYGRQALMEDIKEATGNRPVQITNNITVSGADNPEDWGRRLVRQMNLDMRAL